LTVHSPGETMSALSAMYLPGRSCLVSTEIDVILGAAVAAGAVPGVVAMAADIDGVVYEGAAGQRAADSSDPINPDTMMRIASMTKPVTAVAALQLFEQGSLDLDAGVDTYRPEFASMQVLEGFDGDTPRLRPAAAQATVRDLLTHTSGLAYWIWDEEIDKYEQVTGTPNIMPGTLDAFSAPLVFDPGARLEYGISYDWLGRVIEAVSGQPLDAYFAEHITGPLGMTNTTGRMTAEQRANSTPVHVRDEDGDWQVTDIDWAQQPEFFGGGHFLYSTPRDYLKFQRMLLGGGAVDGTRILSEETVAAAFSNQIGALEFPAQMPTAHPELSAAINLGPGFKFGYGFLLSSVPLPGMRAVGSGSWSGLFNTQFWVDPASGVTGAIYSQTLPLLDPAAFDMYVNFEVALYAMR
jgi:methyl acetate hydrolase